MCPQSCVWCQTPLEVLRWMALLLKDWWVFRVLQLTPLKITALNKVNDNFLRRISYLQPYIVWQWGIAAVNDALRNACCFIGCKPIAILSEWWDNCPTCILNYIIRTMLCCPGLVLVCHDLQHAYILFCFFLWQSWSYSMNISTCFLLFLSPQSPLCSS